MYGVITPSTEGVSSRRSELAPFERVGQAFCDAGPGGLVSSRRSELAPFERAQAKYACPALKSVSSRRSELAPFELSETIVRDERDLVRFKPPKRISPFRTLNCNYGKMYLFGVSSRRSELAPFELSLNL